MYQHNNKNVKKATFSVCSVDHYLSIKDHFGKDCLGVKSEHGCSLFTQEQADTDSPHRPAVLQTDTVAKGQRSPHSNVI